LQCIQNGYLIILLTGKFELSNVKNKTDKGTNIAKSVIEYINEQYDPAMNWKDAEYCVKKWNGPFAFKRCDVS
jgi:L-lactate dehydrogenase (cytochrome)